MRYLILSLLAVVVGCAHSRVSDSPITDPSLPKWTTEDCFKQGTSYYFVGFGEGSNSSAAVRNALITSRQNALTCLFGGTIASNVEISETNSTAQYRSKTELSLNYSHVNWSGYEAVQDRTLHVHGQQTRIYVQYRWGVAEIEKERLRLDNLSKDIEQTKALKAEVSLKESLIQEQKTRLEELDRQSRELAQIKSSSDKAVQKLKQLKASQEEKSRDILKVIDNLYCGITIGKMIELFREPDSVQAVATSEYRRVSYVAFSWDQYQVRVGSDYIRLKLGGWPSVGEMDNRVIEVSKGAPVELVLENYGLTNRGYKICK